MTIKAEPQGNSEKEKILLQHFFEHSPVLGTIPSHEMEIDIHDKTAIRSYPMTVPYKLQDEMKQEINRLMDLGIIHQSESKYTSPAFPIRKRNGKIRLIIDYRKINKVIIPDNFPFPDMHKEIRAIPQSNFFSKIDLTMGYHQLKVREESQQYTSFVTQFGQFEYRRVPFGLTNAPRVFQRVMVQLFVKIPFVKVFLDDILIFSKTREEQYMHLEEVLTIIRKNNIAVNPEKSSFFQEEITYLGHRIGREGIRLDLTNYQELENYKRPDTMRKYQKLCGLINWFRPFIKNLSSLAIPITEKLRDGKTNKRDWTAKEETALRNIFGEIKKGICLAYPDYSKEFTIQTDASEHAIGGILKQDNKLLGLFSKKLTKTQERYTVSEKELLAVVESLKHFKDTIFLSKIKVETDHKNLLYNPPIETSRVQRWKLILNEYNLDWNYIKGENNIMADTLSRICLVKETEEEEVLEGIHQKLGHPGVRIVRNALRPYHNIKNLTKKYQRKREECDVCQKYLRTTRRYGKIGGTLSTIVPFKHISSDIYGPIPCNKFSGSNFEEKFYILTITDRTTRWTECYALKSLSTKELIAHFKK